MSVCLAGVTCISLCFLLKQRKNPFNSELPCEEKDDQLLDGAADQTHAQTEGELFYKDHTVNI